MKSFLHEVQMMVLHFTTSSIKECKFTVDINITHRLVLCIIVYLLSYVTLSVSLLSHSRYLGPWPHITLMCLCCVFFSKWFHIPTGRNPVIFLIHLVCNYLTKYLHFLQCFDFLKFISNVYCWWNRRSPQIPAFIWSRNTWFQLDCINRI